MAKLITLSALTLQGTIPPGAAEQDYSQPQELADKISASVCEKESQPLRY